GQLIICGFNQASLWGMRQSVGRLTGAHFLPIDGEFIGVPRIKDWLKLLNLDINRGYFGCYAPPFQKDKWLERCAFMEKAGNRWWPYFGAAYIVQAVKRVKGMRLIGPAWSKQQAKAPQGVPVTNKLRKADKHRG
ncbi:MAG: SAM-dependent methyltransferase, partial [Proteobacteria bacterium]|nr:SAM-dependent methyltransferase [Pseudomonadota bacterium]